MTLDFSMDDVVAGYGLPGEIIDVSRVGRAWSHRVFRLRTTHGRYAVKQLLNPWRDPNWRSWLSQAADFELAAYRVGTAMPAPALTTTGTILLDVPAATADVTVRVHEWVDGRPCDDGPVDPEVAERVGADLARLHALDHQPTDPDVFPRDDARTIEGWDDLVGRIRRRDPDLADRAAAAEPAVRMIGELRRHAVTDFRGYPMSHGDVDQKNLIITDHGPVLCDWDVAAPWPPRQELARTALSLAVWQRPDVARAVITGYRRAGGAGFEVEPSDLAVDLRIGLDWLGLCLERAAGLRDDGAQRRREAATSAPRLLDELGPRLDQVLQIDTWLAS